ncbi:hypothetical protein ACIBTZ_24045 [Micromonospora sp. NPDC049460]|uniref:hypothetical protein n=1 Tax=unclassified Micromonospora TaxID=2617518 RepID=UPI00371BD2B6
MAWSFGHWLILIVALLVGVAAGWFWRGRQGAAAGHGSPTVEGDPVAGMTAVVVDPPPAATTDEVRPEATLDRAPDAVADPVPAPDAPADADAAPVTVVTTDAGRADKIDPADMALTGDPVPAPDTDSVATAAPSDTAPGDRPDAEVVLPAAAGVTGPVDREPAEEPTTATEPEPVAATEPEPVPAAAAPIEAPAAEPEPARTGGAEPVPATEPEPVRTVAVPAQAQPEAEPVPAAAGPAEPAPAAPAGPDATPAATTPAEPVDEPSKAADPVDEPSKAADPVDEPSKPADPVDEPAEPVVVPAARGAVATPPVRSAADVDADDFRRIQGVGPKMAAALQAAGIRTYGQLAELDEAALRETIRGAGLRAAPSLATWPQQAKVLAGAPQEAAAALPTGGDDA